MSYKDLKSYQQATIIYDFTVEFCKRYIKPANKIDLTDKSYRTADQMEQAARSGKQNIVEGSSERTSEKSELKLLGVARASFQELLEDYEDFLRQRGLKQWDKDNPEAFKVRNLYKTFEGYRFDRTDRTNRTDRSDRADRTDRADRSDRADRIDRADRSDRTNRADWLDRIDWAYKTYWPYLDNAESAANTAICLINQVNFLLDRQIKVAEENFVKKGGYTENLRRKREEEKKQKVYYNWINRLNRD